jgi:hypothetical protein
MAVKTNLQEEKCTIYISVVAINIRTCPNGFKIKRLYIFAEFVYGCFSILKKKTAIISINSLIFGIYNRHALCSV